ncbi:hypothetical protein AB0K52_19950 [Glycomyces sp. NPDC049804]|uniref:hypothetical protein n=1 Tax=Glycomyces sp. NPDC049804 TaxID=3154363 RepID=UPI00341D9D90
MPLQTTSPVLVRQTERWFVRQGMPTMIEGYAFVSHVLPRMLPSLAIVTFASLVWLVPLKTLGSERWVWLGAVLALTATAWLGVSVFVRRQPHFSRTAIAVILIAYAAMPFAVPLLQLAVDDAVTPPGDHAVGLLGFVIFFGLVFAATALATTYGLGTLVRRATRHLVYDLRNSLHLLGRALPAILFVTLFLFFTGEIWQAMNRLPWWRVALVVALFGVITVLAAATRLRDEIGRVEQDLRPSVLASACRKTPLAAVPIEELTDGGPLPPTRLNGRQVRNLLVMLASRQLLQAAFIGLALFAFFVLLGIAVVTPATAEQWIGAPPVYSAIWSAVPVALLKNATMFAAFGSMYFAVISMTDAEHRREFFAPIIDEVERTLAVRAVYLAVRVASRAR